MDENNVIDNAEDLYFDTDSFDFTDLDDVVVDTNELGYNTKQTGKDLMSKEEVEEIDEEDEASDLMDSDEEVEEVDEDEADEVEESDEDESGEVEVTDEDGEEVDFESYEVTLPTGETVVLSEAIKGYKDAQTLQNEKAEFDRLQEEFHSKSEGVSKYLELARLEADRVIEDYEDFDWASYKKDDPVGYVENREFLDRYKSRRQEIISAMDELETKKAADEQIAFKKKADEAGAILARDIPGWNNDLYQQLMMYAIENGANPEDMASCVDASTFKILHKAMQYEKGKQVVKAKVKKLGTPKKVVKATSKPVTQTNNVKRAVIKKMESGNITDKEMSNVFNFLED